VRRRLHKNLLFFFPSLPSPQIIITNEARDQTRITSCNPLVREGFLGVSPKFSNRPTACLGAPPNNNNLETQETRKQASKAQAQHTQVRKQAKASKPPKKSAR